MKRVAVWLCAGAMLATAVPAMAKRDWDKVEALKGTTAHEGLLPVHVDAKKGRILISLPPADAEGLSGRFLYLTALKTGLGSAPVGLDRARLGQTQMLGFRRLGKKVAIELLNPRFRASGAPEAEQAAARDAFAYSTIWVGDLVEEAEDGRLLVDIAGFLTKDTIGIADTLKAAGEAGYKLVPELSLADPTAVKVFPENIEFEARQTYATETPGPEVRNIAPDPRQVSLTVRHSLVKLPDEGYRPRHFDPRAGSFGTQVLDYAAPLGQPIVYDLANRFRLEKVDPTAARSPVKKPIIFYIDRAAPEPIRTALKEGTEWWAAAFDAAGFVDAFKVEILPEGIDPLDVRYNVVNWVNRATRGWSYGQAVTDPRTGEIVKGSVLLGSLRVRQDMLIFEGLVGADKVGRGGPNDPVQAALARIRQLAAHEVGHALGFLHNFAGSTQDRATVMDYPAPRVTLTNGQIDLSDAYGVGVGAWDRFVVDWLYGDPAPGQDAETAAQAKVRTALAQGLRFVSDGEARTANTAYPYGSLWDDGADAAAELRRMMDVRKVAIDRFGLSALAANEPVSNLRRKLVPIWLLHRYQVEAAGKLVGGVDASYAVNGDGREMARPVPASAQRAALAALMATLQPAALDVPEWLVPLLSSGWSGNEDRQFEIEIFRTAGGPVFDPLVATDVATSVTLNALLAPERLNRVADQDRRDPATLGTEEILSGLIDAATAPAAGRLADVRRRIGTRIVMTLARVQRDPVLAPGVAAQIDQQLHDLGRKLAARQTADAAERAWGQSLARLLGDREALEQALAKPERVPPVPPGMPIGAAEEDWMGPV